MGTVILDPVLGGKIRGVITTLFAVYVLAENMFAFADEGWAGNVTKVVAFIVAAIQVLTHGTDVGTSDGDPSYEEVVEEYKEGAEAADPKV